MNYIFGKRMNQIIHGGDYNPEQWLDRPDILNKDIEYMKKAGINEATLGIFSWSVYEPNEGEFHFEWLKEIMDKLYENGIYTILATPSAARPAWLDMKYPEVMRVDGMGNRNRHGLRHNHCLSSTVYQDKVRIIDRKLAENFGNHPGLIMWHISNEFGGECYCDLCKEKFRTYLSHKYDGDIDKLNHEWWTTFWSARYRDFSEIEPPYKNGQTAVMGLNLDWKRFTTQNFCDYISVEIDTIREFSDNKVPITTNLMKRFYDIDYRTFAEKIDVVSWDNYPEFHNDRESFADTMLESAFDHAIIRGLKKDMPFMLMESAPGQVNWMGFNKLRRPGVHRLFSTQALACGSDTVQYFQFRKSRGATEQFHGAVIDHVGTTDTRIFGEVAETGELLKKIAEIEGTVKKNKAAIVFEWENWWAIDDAGGFSGSTKKYDVTCQEYWKALMSLGIEADIIAANDVTNDYKIVIAPMLYSLKEDAAEALIKYVENGGILLGTYMTGYVNENCQCFLGGFPGRGLSSLYGIVSEEIDTLYPSDRNGIKISFNNKQTSDNDIQVSTNDALTIADDKHSEDILSVCDYAEILKITGADVIGTYTDDFYKDCPALTVNKVSSGKAYYQAARCDAASLRILLEQILLTEQIAFEKLEPGIERHTRYSDECEYVFYLNDSDEEVLVNNVSGYDIVTDETVDGTVTLQSKGFAIIKKA